MGRAMIETDVAIVGAGGGGACAVIATLAEDVSEPSFTVNVAV